MKKTSILSAICVLVIITSLSKPICAQVKRNINIDSITIIEEYKDMYRSGDYYFSGQPSLEVLQWIKSEGITLIINLRTEDENKTYGETAFHEENMVTNMGLEYFSVPLGGSDGYSEESLSEFAEILEHHEGKVLIHCLSCYRVTYLMMAYLIEYEDYSVCDVIDFGKQLKYSSPVEELIGRNILTCAEE